ncbi:MAG: phenylacetate--CoA ligase family protein [Candidatus Hodarchaeota archaeon]
MPSSSLRQDQFNKSDKLRQIVIHAAKNSPLYKKKYQGVNLSQNFAEMFDELPLLSREEYYKGMKPMSFSLLTNGIEGTYIFTSGGTTGDVKLTAWSYDFAENWTEECFHSLSAVGLGANDVIINLFFPGIWATHTLINKSLEKAGCRIIPLGGKLSLESIVDYIQKFRVTALIGVPSFIVRLTEYIDTLPPPERSLIKIKKIFYAGEFLTERQAEFIRNRLNCLVSPFLYSSTDTGTIGIKCSHCGTNQYHLPGSMYLETLDRETGEQVPPANPGELVVTSLVNEKAPCIRYKVGDMGIIEETPCPCGNPSPLFTLIGRADDEVKIAGYLINPSIVQTGLEDFPEISRNFQLIVCEDGQKAKLSVICETVPSFSIEGNSDLPERIASSVASSYDILEELIAREYCSPLEVQVVPPGTIPRNPRTGKIKRVRDLR